jgi:hypothetical protein
VAVRAKNFIEARLGKEAWITVGNMNLHFMLGAATIAAIEFIKRLFFQLAVEALMDGAVDVQARVGMFMDGHKKSAVWTINTICVSGNAISPGRPGVFNGVSNIYRYRALTT